MGLHTAGVGVSQSLLPALDTPFLLLGILPYPDLIKGISPCLIPSCFVLFGDCFLDICSFLERKWRRGGGRDECEGQIGVVDREETVAGLYCMRKEYISI